MAHTVQRSCLSAIMRTLLLTIAIETLCVAASQSNCLKDIKVFGPGWDNPGLILPSRYFFIDHPPDCDERIGKVLIKSLTAVRCLVRVQIFNQTQFGNDLIIARYRLVEQSCGGGFQILITDLHDNVIKSKAVTEVIYDEQCNCPKEDWFDQLKCDSSDRIYDRLRLDLAQFNETGIVFNDSLNEMKTRFAPYERSYSFCHYQVIENKVHRKCYGEYVGFAQFMDDMLLSLTRKSFLPNTEFIVNLGDWPLSANRKGLAPIPIFSWCGSDDTYDIVLPTYETTESVLNMQGRVSTDILSVFGKQQLQFNDKSSKLFWRGRDSHRARLKLVLLSKENPDLIDAALTNFFFFRGEIETYGPSVPYTNFFEFFDYKYQLNMDGTVAAYRLPSLLAGSSLVLKQESKYYEFFYHLLKDGVHYLKLQEDIEDLLPVLKKLNSSEMGKEAQQQIIYNARKVVLDNVLPANVYCYYFKTIADYTLLLKNDVILEPSMQLVTPDYTCDCKNKLRDEL